MFEDFIVGASGRKGSHPGTGKKSTAVEVGEKKKRGASRKKNGDKTLLEKISVGCKALKREIKPGESDCNV